MRRAARAVFYTLLIALCAATILLWVRSSNHLDHASVVTPSRHFVAMTFPGGVTFSTWPDPAEPPSGPRLHSYPYEVRNAYGAWVSPQPTDGWKLGFDLQPVHFSNEPAPRRRAFRLSVPFWSLMLLCAVPPLVGLRRNVVRR